MVRVRGVGPVSTLVPLEITKVFVRNRRIELLPNAWEAFVLPLN